MLHLNEHLHLHRPHLGNIEPVIKARIRSIALVSALVLLFVELAIFFSSQTGLATVFANHSAISKPASQNVPDLDSLAAKSQMTDMYAQRLYLTEPRGTNNSTSDNINSADSIKVLIQSLQQDQPIQQRQSAITALTIAPTTAVSVLIDALTDTDPGVRRGVAEVLGARRALEAEEHLYFATYDPDPKVQIASVNALAEIGSPFILPRLEWIQVTDTDADLHQAAQIAEKKIYAHIATTLNVPSANLRAVAIAPSNARVYAASVSDLYVLIDFEWNHVTALPNPTTALAATGNNGQIVYLGTANAGILRSTDGGHTWQAINAGLATNTQFTITALTVNPIYPKRLYATLAVPSGTTLVPMIPVGIFQSKDGGDTWSPLVQWKIRDVTTRLVIDPLAPSYLYGLTEIGAWQYPLKNRTDE